MNAVGWFVAIAGGWSLGLCLAMGSITLYDWVREGCPWGPCHYPEARDPFPSAAALRDPESENVRGGWLP